MVPTSQPTDRAVRVLELSQGLAGAVCGRLFAGLGHDVVKCEPPGGDHLRGTGATGPSFLEMNAGKRGLERGAGLDDVAVLRLTERADVVIVDAEPTSAPLSASSLRERFPGLVVVAVSTFGLQRGLPDGGGDSLLAEAYGGLASMIGEPDGAPLTLGGEQAAYMAGFIGVFGAMLALRRRAGTGRGDLVEVALSDVVAYLDWKSDVRHRTGSTMPRRGGASAGRWQLIRAADGWVGVIFQGTQWPALVELVDDERLRDPALADESYRGTHPQLVWPAITEWAARLPGAEIYRRAQAAQLPFGRLVPLPEVTEIEQFRARGFVTDNAATVLGSPAGPGLAWSSAPAPGLGEHAGELDDIWAPRAPEASRLPAGTGDAPLAGIRVVDLGTITAGAAAGRMLADYGAEVIKVESPSRPDSFRRWIVDTESPNAGAGRTGIAPMFDSNNAGKLAVALDLKTAAGLAALKGLVSGADVLIENYSAGVAQRLGIGFDDLIAINPRLVYLSLSSQGQHGPEALSRSYGSTLDLLSGLSSITGYDADHPMWSGVAVNYPDQLASVFGATLTVACLATGVTGVHLDLAQREVVSWTLSGEIRRSLGEVQNRGGGFAGPTGNRRPGRSPHDIYPCSGADEWLALSCRTDEQRAALAELAVPAAVGHPDLVWWTENADDVDKALAAWTAQRSAPAGVAQLTGAGIPSAPVSTPETRAHDDHFTAKRIYLDDGERRLKGFPMVLHGYAPPIPPLAPRLGEHTEQVLLHEGRS